MHERKVYVDLRYHPRLQFKVSVTPHYLKQEDYKEVNSNTDLAFHKSFDRQKRITQLVAVKEAAHTTYPPISYFPSV